ncbi:MAG TPA: cytochrome c [Prosthecobacter sp.]
MNTFFHRSLAASLLLLPTPLLLARQVAPAASESHARGQTVYMQVCFACHQPTGQGLPGMFPPLAGSDWVTAIKPDRMIRMVLHGFTGPFTLKGVPFKSPAPLMPPQGAALNDQQIADVLTYVRGSFGNKASGVSPEEVKAIREAEKARSAMWTEAELLKISVE